MADRRSLIPFLVVDAPQSLQPGGRSCFRDHIAAAQVGFQVEDGSALKGLQALDVQPSALSFQQADGGHGDGVGPAG